MVTLVPCTSSTMVVCKCLPDKRCVVCQVRVQILTSAVALFFHTNADGPNTEAITTAVAAVVVIIGMPEKPSPFVPTPPTPSTESRPARRLLPIRAVRGPTTSTPCSPRGVSHP
jgi:hypothetical protein